jgi:N-acetylglutamate synthase-like GNAT family acetyltransferase
MKIRRVKEKDAEEIYQLRKNTFEKINARDYNSKQIKTLVNSNSSKLIIRKMKEREMFCLEDKGKILGVIDLEKNKIGGLFIREDLIGKGYGKKLMKFIENYAQKKGIKKVILYSTIYAENFYKKLDYVLIEKKHKYKIGNISFSNIKLEKKL